MSNETLNIVLDTVPYLVIVLLSVLLYRSIPRHGTNRLLDFAGKLADKTPTKIDDSLIDMLETLLGGFGYGVDVTDVTPTYTYPPTDETPKPMNIDESLTNEHRA
jgi:hypothetical protein